MDITTARNEVLRVLVPYLRKYPDVGKFPSEHDSAVSWISDLPVTKAYLWHEPKVTAYGDYGVSYGKTRDHRAVVESLIETAFDLLTFVQPERTKAVYDALTSRQDYPKLKARRQDLLYAIYQLSLEQGPIVIGSDTFLAQRLAMVTESEPLYPASVGRLVKQLEQRKFVEIDDPGSASWVVHLRSSRKLRLFGNY